MSSAIGPTSDAEHSDPAVTVDVRSATCAVRGSRRFDELRHQPDRRISACRGCVARIFEGARPAELPVLLPTKLELAINLDRQGTRPRSATSILALAHEVIE